MLFCHHKLFFESCYISCANRNFSYSAPKQLTYLNLPYWALYIKTNPVSETQAKKIPNLNKNPEKKTNKSCWHFKSV